MIIKYSSYIKEAIDQEFLTNNPNFYLLNKSNKYNDEEQKADEFYKNLDYKKIEYQPVNDDNNLNFVNIVGLRVKVYYKGEEIYLFMRKYYPKVIYSIIYNSMNRDTFTFICPYNFKHYINEIFTRLQYYGLYFHDVAKGYTLFLTKDSKKYSEKIKYCKDNNIKIIYYNNNVKGGREFFDIDKIKTDRIVQKFKKVAYDDMYYEKLQDNVLQLRFKDSELDNYFGNNKMKFILANNVQLENSLFGVKVGHRYHIKNIGLPEPLMGIGLGYKLYKKLIFTTGYICSNSSLSEETTRIYSKLLKDPDFYTVVVTSTHPMLNKVLIIDKNFKKISELIKLVQEQEKLDLKKDKKFNIKYIYDKELIAYLSKAVNQEGVY